MDTQGIMIEGSTGGEHYIAVARKGPVALAIKCVGFQPVEAASLAGHTCMHLRVRSANAKEKLEALDDGVSKPAFTNLVTSWPKLKFSRVNESRAAFDLHFQVHGVVLKDALDFEQNYNASNASGALANFLLDAAEGSELLLTAEQISQHIDSMFRPVIERFKEHQFQMACIQRAISKHVGKPYDYQDIIDDVEEKMKGYTIEGVPPNLPKDLH